MFRAKFIFVFSSLVSIRLCIYAIYNISSLVFFNSFNDGWHEQEWIWIEIQMSVAGRWAWNSDLGQSHISVDWKVGAVGGFVGFCGSFGVVALLISFSSHQRCVSSQGYTWSSLHKWQNTVVGTVYIIFVCLLYTRVTNVYKALGNGSIWFTVTFWVNLIGWTMTAL